MWSFPSSELKHIVEHRATRDRLLVADKLSGSEADDLDILSSDIAAIVEGIKNRRWTSTTVVKAFIRSARRSQEANNFITEGEWCGAGGAGRLQRRLCLLRLLAVTDLLLLAMHFQSTFQLL